MAAKVRWNRESRGFLEQAGDGFKEAGDGDEFTDLRWDLLQGRVGSLQFLSDSFDVNLSEALLECGVTLENDFQVRGVCQIPDQEGVGDHALQ